MAGRSARYAVRKNRLLALLTAAFTKAQGNRGALRAVMSDLQLLLRMLRAWARGHYRQLPKSTVMAAIAAVLYFVSPVDAIADIIPVAGFVDDFFILSWVFSQIQTDVRAFEQWELEHGGPVIDADYRPAGF